MHNISFYTKFREIIRTRNTLLIKGIQTKKSERFFKAIKYSLINLKDEYRMILENSYFGCSYKFWWIDYFCKSSFYRKRYWAVVAFVRLFEMIYENFNDFSSYSSLSM